MLNSGENVVVQRVIFAFIRPPHASESVRAFKTTSQTSSTYVTDAPMADEEALELPNSTASARSTTQCNWCCSAAAPSAAALGHRLQCFLLCGLDESGCRAAAWTRPSSASAAAASPIRCSILTTCAPERSPHPLGRPPEWMAAALSPLVGRLSLAGGAAGEWPRWHPHRSVCPMWCVQWARAKWILSIYCITNLGHVFAASESSTLRSRLSHWQGVGPT
jgi:hypothetical protein